MKLKFLVAALILSIPYTVQARPPQARAEVEKPQETSTQSQRLLDTQKGAVVSENGKIDADTNYWKLQKQKMEKLWDGALPYQEGNCRLATVAYRGTPSEIEIFWKDDPKVTCYQKLDLDWSKLKKPDLIRVRRADSPWTTDQGIHIGTTLEELEKINGGSVGFIGMGWDMGGACCVGKAFSKHIGVTLEADEEMVHTQSEASKYYTEHLTGDQRVESKDIPEAIKKALKIRVKEVFLNF